MTAHHFPFQLLSLLRDTRGMLIFREFEHPLVQRASNSISIKPQNKKNKTRLYEKSFGSFESRIRFKNTPEAICGEGAVLRVDYV